MSASQLLPQAFSDRCFLAPYAGVCVRKGCRGAGKGCTGGGSNYRQINRKPAACENFGVAVGSGRQPPGRVHSVSEPCHAGADNGPGRPARISGARRRLPARRALPAVVQRINVFPAMRCGACPGVSGACGHDLHFSAQLNFQESMLVGLQEPALRPAFARPCRGRSGGCLLPRRPRLRRFATCS